MLLDREICQFVDYNTVFCCHSATAGKSHVQSFSVVPEEIQKVKKPRPKLNHHLINRVTLNSNTSNLVLLPIALNHHA